MKSLTTQISEMFQCILAANCDGLSLAVIIDRGDLAYFLGVLGCLIGVVIIGIVLSFRDGHDQ